MDNIVNIKVSNIYPHPDNPRKEVGDVTELSESIKVNGIMQNLTVIPITALTAEPDEQPDADTISLKSDFHVLIGHRRLAAIKAAGLVEAPCKIVSQISKKEQVAIMLEENMQREDLTIFEQAQGFQMMLDLGETEDTIAEKTGFSKTTIKHRLNLAKLDQEELKKKEQDENFQMSLKDLYELEKIDDIETRNRLLKEATDSNNLTYRIANHLREKIKQEKTEQIIKMLEEKGIKKAPKQYAHEKYSGKWNTVKDYRLDGDVPKKISIKKEDDEPLYYDVQWYAVQVVKKSKKAKKEATPEELRKKQIAKNKKEITAKLKRMDEQRKLFIENILSGKIAVKETANIKDAIWCVLLLARVYTDVSNLRRFFTGKADYECTQEEKDEANGKVKGLSIFQQMLLTMHFAMEHIGDIYDYYGIYKENIGQALMDGYKILEQYGWSFESEEDEQILDGTHPLYAKKDDD